MVNIENEYMFLNAKFDPKSPDCVNVVDYYINNNKFFEAFQFVNNRLYFDNDGSLFYRLLSKYLEHGDYSNYNPTPLIMTWTIKPNNIPFLEMVDPDIRLKEHLLGLASWILDKSFSHLIIIDSSVDFTLNKQALIKIGSDHGKSIEFHKCSNTEGASKFGKGYGEGELMKYVVENVSTVAHSKKLVKMNGKQYIPFYEYLYMNRNGCFEFFNTQYLGKPAIDTRFYCVTTDYYLNTLNDIYTQVNDHEVNYLEHVFQQNTKDRVNYFLAREPIVFGKQGSTNKNYGDFPKIVYDFQEILMEKII